MLVWLKGTTLSSFLKRINSFCLFILPFVLLSPPTCTESNKFMAMLSGVVERNSGKCEVQEAGWGNKGVQQESKNKFNDKIGPWMQNGVKLTRWMFAVRIVFKQLQQCCCFHAETGQGERTWHKLNSPSSYRSQRHPIRLQLIPARQRLHHWR